MELKYLNTFRTIVEEGTFSGAARKLNYTQSTITFQIGQLENELSVKLFEKIGRKMVLTKAGEQLVPYVDNVIASVDKMCCFENDAAFSKEELRIGVGETLLSFKMPSVLKEFHRQAPLARLFIRSMNCYDIRDGLLDGTLDLGVFYRETDGFGSSLCTYPMGKYKCVLTASSENAIEYSDFISPDRKIDIPFIINEKNCIFRQIFENYLKTKSIVLGQTIELWSIHTIKNLVKSNMGVSYLPYFAVENDLKNGELYEIQTDIENSYINAVCAHHKNKWLSPAMKLFVELCRKAQCEIADI